MEVIAKAAGYQTKRSWWLVEEGRVELASWRWQLVLEAAERGELARSGRAAGKTRKGVVILVDELLWASDARRVDVAQAAACLMDSFEVSTNAMAEATGMSHKMLTQVLGGKARKQMTSQRVEAIRAALVEMMRRAGEAMRVFEQDDRLSAATLRALRLGMRVSQDRAGSWAAPLSVSPSALMSAYECGSVCMPVEAASRLSYKLTEHYRSTGEHPAWSVLDNPSGAEVLN